MCCTYVHAETGMDTGAARTKIKLGILQGTLVILGSRGLRAPRGPNIAQGACGAQVGQILHTIRLV